MSNFKKKLSKIISENAVVYFNNTDYSQPVAEDEIVGEIAALAPMYGLIYLGYSEGVLSFSTYTKSSVTLFTNELDRHPQVDIYDISAAITDPLTKESEITNEFDFDTTRESQFIEFFIDVALISDVVNYNDVYVGLESPAVDDFIYPMKSGNVENPYSVDLLASDQDINFGLDTLPASETPLLIKLSAEQSASPVGQFIITTHPDDKDEILIQATYSEVPEYEHVMKDLQKINLGEFGDSFEDSFKLSVPAQYTSGSTNTTSAIFKTYRKKDPLSIVESLMDIIDEVHYDSTLLEVKRVIKVNAMGKRKIKMQCQPGFKYDPDRMTCVKIAGDELAISRIAHRQMARTKRSFGDSYKTRIIRRAKRAKRFRKLMGL